MPFLVFIFLSVLSQHVIYSWKGHFKSSSMIPFLVLDHLRVRSNECLNFWVGGQCLFFLNNVLLPSKKPRKSAL